MNVSKNSMNVRKMTLWLVQTAMMIALLITIQYASIQLNLMNAIMGPMNVQQFITGSLVNMMLVLSTVLFGFWTGVAVASVSPFMALLIGMSPRWELVPVIALSNIVFVAIWYIVTRQKLGGKYELENLIALIVAAVSKFLVLWLGIVHILAPALGMPPAAPVYVLFSYPQLVTATIGGIIAIVILPPLTKGLRSAKLIDR